MDRTYYVYILSNNSGTLYVGVTNNLERRIYEHKHELISGFTQKYKLKKLIYFEQTPDVLAAITQKKQLKGWTRAKKLALISILNPNLEDLDPSLRSG